MRRKFFIAILAIAAFFAILTVYFLDKPVILRYEITIPPDADNHVMVQVSVENYSTRSISFEKSGVFIDVSDIETGTGISAEKLQESVLLESESKFTPTLSYRADFGMYYKRDGDRIIPGRHGRQGYLDSNFGLVRGGNIFILPDIDEKIRDVKITFDIRNRMDVYTTWDDRKNFFTQAADNHELKKNLIESVIGFGEFYRYKVLLENPDCEFIVYIEKSRSPEEADIIFKRLYGIFNYQLQISGSPYISKYISIIVPWIDEKGYPETYAVYDKNKIMGWNSCYGQGFSLKTENKRDYEVFAHRVQHAITRDQPAGMNYRSLGDIWFYEALASYYEPLSLYKIGMLPDLSRFRDFYYNVYLYMRKTYPSYQAPVSRDFLQGPDTVNFLHYIEAPVILLGLNEYIERKSRGEKNFDHVLRNIVKNYAGGGKFSVREILDNKGIEPDFHERYINQSQLLDLTGYLNREPFIPTWLESETANKIVSVNGEKISERDLREYDRCLRPMIENDLGSIFLEQEFPEIKENLQGHLYFWFFNRFGEHSLEYYRENGYFKIMAVLKLLDKEASRLLPEDAQAYSGIKDMQGVKALNRLKLRFLKTGIPFSPQNLHRIKIEDNELVWYEYIRDLVDSADIIYY